MHIDTKWTYRSLTGPLWGVTIGHFLIALLVVIDGVGTTSIIGLRDHRAGDWVPIGIGAYWLALAYAGGSVVAMIGLLQPERGIIFHVSCWIGQQTIMFVGAISIIEAIAKSQYLDGVGTPESGITITRSHLITDQYWYLLVCVIHFTYFWTWQAALRKHSESTKAVQHAIHEAQNA